MIDETGQFWTNAEWKRWYMDQGRIFVPGSDAEETDSLASDASAQILPVEGDDMEEDEPAPRIEFGSWDGVPEPTRLLRNSRFEVNLEATSSSQRNSVLQISGGQGGLPRICDTVELNTEIAGEQSGIQRLFTANGIAQDQMQVLARVGHSVEGHQSG